MVEQPVETHLPSAPGAPGAGPEPARPAEPMKTPAKAPAKAVEKEIIPPREEMRPPEKKAAPAKELLSTPLTKITDTTLRGLLADMQPVIKEIGGHQTINKIKHLFGIVFGTGAGAALPAKALEAVSYIGGPTVSVPFAEQALHMGAEAGGYGLAVGGVAAGVQMATDAIRALGLGEDHRHLLIRTLLRTGGRPEAYMMRQIALGNRGHIKALNIFDEKVKQGLMDWKHIGEKHNDYLRRMVVSAIEAMAGLQTIDLLAPVKVADAIRAKEGGKDGKPGYLEQVQNAFGVAQDIYTKVFNDENRKDFNKNFPKWMKNRTALNTTKAILFRGAYQVVRIGPWALAGSLAAGLYKVVGGLTGIKGFATKTATEITGIPGKTAAGWEGFKTGVDARWVELGKHLPVVTLPTVTLPQVPPFPWTVPGTGISVTGEVAKKVGIAAAGVAGVSLGAAAIAHAREK